jgi:hypothetical protein
MEDQGFIFGVLMFLCKHMLDFAKFVKYNSWTNGCSYFLEDPFTDIPTMIRSKIADYTLSRLVEKV